MGKQSAIPLPRGWPRFAKSALLHAVALARVAMLDILSGFENSPLVRARLLAENERLRFAHATLAEENRILRARYDAVAPGRRPHYPPTERLAILALRAATGWTVAEAARRFQVTAQTIAAWIRRLDEQGPEALVRSPVPINRFPDLVTGLVHQVKRCAPRFGRKRIANVLARGGLHLAASTVKRMLARRPPAPPAPRPAPCTTSTQRPGETSSTKPLRRIRADYPHHLWHIDLSLVPTLGGLWVPWLCLSLPTLWPFAWRLCVVLNHFSRAPVAWAVFAKEPTAADVCGVLDRAVRRAGRAPRHIVSDRGVQFQSEYRDWCTRHDVKPRFGALGKHGSIAVLERFWRSLKSECLRLLLVPLARPAMEREIAAYMAWYVDHRPHESLHGATPGEVLRSELPAAGRQLLEPRARWPLARGDPDPVLRRRVEGRLELVITSHEGRAHLPVVELREAA